MRTHLLRVLGLGSLIAVLIAGGGYYAYAQSAAPETASLEPSSEAAGAWLGVVVATSSEPAGVRVTKVLKDSPADKADVRVGDVITALGGVAIANPAALKTEMAKHSPGDAISITVNRAGSVTQIPVTLGAASVRPQHRDRSEHVRPPLGVMPFSGMMQGGFESNVSGSFTRIEDGNKVIYDISFGVVTDHSRSSVTIDPNGPDGVVSFPITANTKSRGDVKTGAKVIAVRKNGELTVLMVVREPQKRENRTEGKRGENKDKKRVQEFEVEPFGAFPATGALERFPALREKWETHGSDLAERFAPRFVH